MQTTAKRVIAIDCDEVLTYFVQHLVSYYNRIHASDEYKNAQHARKPMVQFDDFHTYHFTHVWGGADNEATQIVESFFESEEFAMQGPVAGAQQALVALSQDYDLYVVTSRQHVLEQQTRTLIQTYYPNLFQDVLFGNHYGSTGKKMSKPELMATINAELLIDDSIQYAQQCVQAGQKAILFGTYPWNKQQDVEHDSLVRVQSWAEVPDIVHKMLKL